MQLHSLPASQSASHTIIVGFHNMTGNHISQSSINKEGNAKLKFQSYFRKDRKFGKGAGGEDSSPKYSILDSVGSSSKSSSRRENDTLKRQLW